MAILEKELKLLDQVHQVVGGSGGKSADQLASVSSSWGDCHDRRKRSDRVSSHR
jgi:hypothetical protein